MDNEKILRNSVKCKKCYQELESTHVHDYKWCSCGTCMVDGGKEYLRRGWANGLTQEDAYEETSLYGK